MSRWKPGSAAGPAALRHRGWYNRGYLPHHDPGDVVQMITYRLADALPREALRRDAGESAARRRLTIDRFLDRGYGSCLLKAADIARCVVENWRHFDGDSYRLHAWVVMPNHVHVLIEVREGHPLSEIVHAWKSYTAHVIRRLRGDTGRVWQPEYWDRMIRDDLHYLRAVEYIEMNPVRAGLVHAAHLWPWSSAAAPQAGGPPALPQP
jgi:REP element-mobilizing transposase RayT